MPKLLHLKERVKEILEVNERARDSDNLLITIVWEVDLQLMDIAPIKAPWTQVAHLLMNHSISNPISIVRVRRKLQSIHPELQGTVRKMRMAEQQVVKDDLKGFTP